MERGLPWLLLLVFFIWLTWTGWNEYRKVEAYRLWSEEFEQAKYDLYAVLGKKGTELTWGKPTHQGPVELQTFSLEKVQGIELLVGDRAVDWDTLPTKGKAALSFDFAEQQNSIRVPFTDIALAAKWGKYLQQEWKKLKSQP